jgi:hypothetical protein
MRVSQTVSGLQELLQRHSADFALQDTPPVCHLDQLIDNLDDLARADGGVRIRRETAA